MRTAWVYPGQGSQAPGMGRELFPRYPELVALADEILGWPLAEACEGVLTDTRQVQPALFVVSALHHLERIDREPPPDYLAGHSLGEYNALFAAGCFDFETGVRLVRRRGELMAAVTGGAMLAVLGLDRSRVEELIGPVPVDFANHNSARQFVLAGPNDDVRAIADRVRTTSGKSVLLNVSIPAHSRYMATAAEKFAADLHDLRPPRIPVIANVTARPYDDLPRLMRDQITHPVRWFDSMRWLIDHGVTEVSEVGPGDVLTKLWKRVTTEQF